MSSRHPAIGAGGDGYFERAQRANAPNHGWGHASSSAAMKAFPEGVARHAGTPVFSDGSIPTNLRRAHRTKAGTWAKIVVLEGRIRYRILEPDVEEVDLFPGRPGIVEPEVLHEVEAPGRVRVRVDFYR